MWAFSIFRRFRVAGKPSEKSSHALIDDLNDEASRAMKQAELIAKRLQGEYLGTEHLLLGLIESAPNRVTRLLQRCNVNPEHVREAVERIDVQAQDMVPMECDRPRTPAVNRALKNAKIEAETRRLTHIDAPALLIGLLSDEYSLAFEILRQLGLQLETARAAARTLDEGEN